MRLVLGWGKCPAGGPHVGLLISRPMTPLLHILRCETSARHGSGSGSLQGSGLRSINSPSPLPPKPLMQPLWRKGDFFFFSLLIQLLEKNALTELCQVTQSISGENQPELVREAADLHSGKMSEGSNPGQAVLERGALLELGAACCCTPCLGPLGTQGVCRS